MGSVPIKEIVLQVLFLKCPGCIVEGRTELHSILPRSEALLNGPCRVHVPLSEGYAELKHVRHECKHKIRPHCNLHYLTLSDLHYLRDDCYSVQWGKTVWQISGGCLTTMDMDQHLQEEVSKLDRDRRNISAPNDRSWAHTSHIDQALARLRVDGNGIAEVWQHQLVDLQSTETVNTM
jgi:hypothetical protein